MIIVDLSQDRFVKFVHNVWFAITLTVLNCADKKLKRLVGAGCCYGGGVICLLTVQAMPFFVKRDGVSQTVCTLKLYDHMCDRELCAA